MIYQSPVLQPHDVTVEYGGYVDEDSGHPHAGLDLDVTSGAPDINGIKSVSPGIVSGKDFSDSLGHWVVVQHTDQYGALLQEYSLYAHLASASPLNENDPVGLGDAVGTMGNTGRVIKNGGDGVHLHYSLHLSQPMVAGSEGLTDIPIGTFEGDYIVVVEDWTILNDDTDEQTLLAYGGEDSWVYALTGNDEVHGYQLADQIHGGLGNDTIYGNGGDDTIRGGSEFSDSYNGITDDDDLRGGAGDDVIFGGAGSDTIYGGGISSYDPLQTENDTLFGGDGDDHIYGELGLDEIYGGTGNDTAYYEGTSGEDRFFWVRPIDGDGIQIEEITTSTNASQLNGADILYDVETLNFADGLRIDVSTIIEPIKVVNGANGLTVEDVDEPGFVGRTIISLKDVFGFDKPEDDFEVVNATQSGGVALRDLDTGGVYEFVAGSFVEFLDTPVLAVAELQENEPIVDDHADTRDGTATLVSDLDGTVVQGEIEVSGDEDVFRFSTQSGQTYGVVAAPDNSGVDPEIKVYNSSGQLVASNDDLGSGPSAGLSFIANGGSYYVEVSGEGGSTGDYGIGVAQISDGSGGSALGDASEPDVDVPGTGGRNPTDEGDDGDDTWIFSSSSSSEVFIVMNGGDDVARTGRRDDIVFGGDGDDEIETRDGNDLIDGGDDEDSIEGGDGNDGILGGRDDDSIDGGDGDDIIAGQHGEDRIDGGDDDDVISGGDGDDRLDGENGNDGILGDGGDDNIDGGSGNDVIYGGDDDDRIDGESGQDVLYGDDGRDTIYGGTGDDRIDGGAHDDTLVGDEGNDSISGGSGDDIIRPGAGDDSIDGDGGSDTLSYERMDGGATIDMEEEIAYGAEIGFDRFDSIDHIIGTDDEDLIIGDSDDNRLNGHDGSDTITGGAGNDEIDGGSSSDTAVFSGNRADYTLIASINPEFDLQIIDNRAGSPDGTDLLHSIAFLQFADVRIRDDDALSSAPTANDDTFEVTSDGPAILDVLINDTDPDGNILSISEVVALPESGLAYVVDNRIVFDPDGEFTGANEQIVSLSYRISDGAGWTDEATVTVTVTEDETPPPSGESMDWSLNPNGFEIYLAWGITKGLPAFQQDVSIVQNVTGSAFDDRLAGNASNNILSGGAGNDVIKGKGGSDTLSGDAGSDKIVGGNENDSLFGGSGTDFLIGLAGDDRLSGGADRDFIYGGRDNDSVFGGDGDDAVRGNLNNDVVQGNGGNDDVRGGGGTDVVQGNEGDDFVVGGGGTDTVDGGVGNDVLLGGRDNSGDGFVDNFVFGASGVDYGFDRVRDFEDGLDLIDLSGLGLLSFTDVQSVMSDTAFGVRLDFGANGTLLLEDTSVALLTATDFLLIA